jgi:hypothetical protein
MTDGQSARLAWNTRRGVFLPEKGHQIFIVNLCDKRGNHGVKNTVDLGDLQNTLDWS